MSKESPSMSSSFNRTSIWLFVESSGTLAESLSASGGSFTAVTVILTKNYASIGDESILYNLCENSCLNEIVKKITNFVVLCDNFHKIKLFPS